MDLFKLTNKTAPLKMDQGLLINDLKSVMWVERYRDSGEFTIVASVESGVKDILTVGSFISHANTTEVMIVENHEIKEDQGQNADVTITGRSFETILDTRIVGANRTFPVSGTVADISLGTTYPATQAVNLMNQHITTASLINDDDSLPYITPTNAASGIGVSTFRAAKRGSVYVRVLELLELDNLGIKNIRPGPWSPLGGSSPNMAIMVHKGVDRSKTLMISREGTDFKSADYLWSNKQFKNAALVTGKWVETVVYYPATSKEYDRRMMFIEGTEFDEDLTAPPTGSALTTVVNSMQQKALDMLKAQTNTVLVRADVGETPIQYTYRKDYDVGDLVTVSGDYHQRSVMRVSEFVEIDDDTGGHSYPTLTIEDG